MSAPALKPFPFFVGCERSGTTMLRAMFDAHPELAVPPETYFVVQLGRRRSRYERAGGFDVARFTDDLIAHRQFPRLRVPAESLREAVLDSRPRSLADGFRVAFALYARRQNKPRYGEKTPNYVLSVPLLADLFPEARFVHLIRDGRDVARSLMEVSFGPSTIAGAAVFWRRRVARGRAAGQALGEDRYREVAYEALVTDPDGTLGDLCSFLELSYDPSMLRYHERSPAELKRWAVGRYHSNLVRPPTKALRDWRRDMAPADVAVFEALAGDLLSELGYERAFPDRSVSPVNLARHRVEAGLRSVSRVAYRNAWRVFRRGRRDLQRSEEMRTWDTRA